MKALLALLGATLLYSLRTVGTNLLLSLVGPKVIEWAVLKALTWLSKRTDSRIDDQLLAVVTEAMQGPTPDSESSETQHSDAAAQPSPCPNCGFVTPAQ